MISFIKFFAALVIDLYIEILNTKKTISNILTAGQGDQSVVHVSATAKKWQFWVVRTTPPPLRQLWYHFLLGQFFCFDMRLIS